MKLNFLHEKIILASNSPQRAALLREHGFDFKISPADIDEEINPKESPEENAERLAREKAKELFKGKEHIIVLGADTIGVSPMGEILTKAKSRDEAEKMIRNRSGKSEKVITGWAIFSNYGIQSGAEISEVFYEEISEGLLKEILDSEEWKGVAGALRIEGKIMRKMIKGYEGDYTNILGLPIGKITDVLRHFPLERKT